MATRDELNSKENNCSSVGDFISLAEEALTEPTDEEYARELLEQAELECQDPGEYVRLATVLFTRLNERDSAAQLLEDAEDACFDAMEYAEVGAAVASILGEKEKGKELIQNAAAEAVTSDEKIKLSAYASSAGDSELANSLLSSVTSNLSDLSGYLGLAKKLLEAGNEEQAKAITLSAERYLESVADIVNFAQTMIELFDDRAKAEQLLENAEMDCQFPKDFIDLATGYREVLDDASRLDELLDEAANCAMEGQEFLEVAQGYWDLAQDADNAKQYFEQALSDINDRQILLDTAALASERLNNPELAAQYYRRAVSKITSPSEIAKLAAEIWHRTEDKAYAIELFDEANDKISNLSELVSLATLVMQTAKDLDRAVKAYQKALATVRDFSSVEKLLESSKEVIDDLCFTKEVITKMRSVASSTTEFVATCRNANSVLDDAFQREVLLAAEDAAASPDDLELVQTTVKEFIPEDVNWQDQLADKITRRRANVAKYSEVQKKEAVLKTALESMRLAKEVAVELDDTAYAAKLVERSRDILNSQNFDGAQWQTMIEVAAQHINDPELTESIVTEATQHCHHFSSACQLAHTVVATTKDKCEGMRLATFVLEEQQNKTKTCAHRIKLAKVTNELLKDADQVASIINSCDLSKCTYLQTAELGALANSIGRSDQANELCQTAARKCGNTTELIQLVNKLKQDGTDPFLIKKIYSEFGETLTNEVEQLRWAEGILEVFADREWAKSAYQQVLPTDKQSPLYASFQASRRQRLENRL